MKIVVNVDVTAWWEQTVSCNGGNRIRASYWKTPGFEGKKRLCKSTAAMETRQWKLGPVNDPCRSNSGGNSDI